MQPSKHIIYKIFIKLNQVHSPVLNPVKNLREWGGEKNKTESRIRLKKFSHSNNDSSNTLKISSCFKKNEKKRI